MGLRPLTSSDLDVWLTPSELAREPSLVARYAALLSEEERARHARIIHEETRHQFLVARALIRTTMSRYSGGTPEHWLFQVNEYGRPALRAGQTDLDLRFNLSHTHGLVACAVALGRDVGIDVEWNRRNPSMLDSVERFFSPAEVSDLHALPPSARAERFFQVWTLKESYIKAHGMGLSMPLSGFSFRLASDAKGESAINVEMTLGEGPGQGPGPWPGPWQFWLWNPTSEHTLGLSAAFPRDAPVNLRVEKTIPLT